MGSIGTDLLHSDMYLDQTKSAVTTTETAKKASDINITEISISDEDVRVQENVQAMGDKLGQALRDRIGNHKNVGDIRGRGLAWGIELVKDKTSKEPFAAQEEVAGRLHVTGLTSDAAISVLPGQGMADGINGDVILVASAYNITADDIEVIVNQVEQVIKSVLG